MRESIVNDRTFCLGNWLGVFEELGGPGMTVVGSQWLIGCMGPRGRTRTSPSCHFVEGVLEYIVPIADGLFCCIFDLLGLRTGQNNFSLVSVLEVKQKLRISPDSFTLPTHHFTDYINRNQLNPDSVSIAPEQLLDYRLMCTPHLYRRCNQGVSQHLLNL